jgi:hypothetical protein
VQPLRVPTPSNVKLSYLASPDVQKDLNLSREKIATVDGLRAKWEELLKDFARLNPDEQGKKLIEGNETVDKGLMEALDPAQAKRLKQIMLQEKPILELGFRRGRVGGRIDFQRATVLLESGVVRELEIDAEQKEKIQGLVEDATKVYTLISQENWGDQREDDPSQEFREATEKRLLALLTKDQQEKWKEMLGEPFTGQVRSDFPGRRFGGPFVP